MTVSACAKERRPSTLKERVSGEGGAVRGGGSWRERGRLDRANDPNPDPERAKGRKGVTFIRPSLAPRPPPLCRKGTPTERKESGEGARGGQGESKTPQEPSGGDISKDKTLWGTKRVTCWWISGGSDSCVFER